MMAIPAAEAQTSTTTEPSAAPTEPSSSGGFTITVRLIKSFEFRTTKNLVLHGIDPAAVTVADVRALVLERIQTTPGFKPYLTTPFDSFKIYVKAHGTKTQNLVINFDHDEDYFLPDGKTLEACGVEHETEISFFNRAAYEAYKANPENKW